MRTRRAWLRGLANPRAFLATSFAVRLWLRLSRESRQHGVDDRLLPFIYRLGEGFDLGDAVVVRAPDVKAGELVADRAGRGGDVGAGGAQGEQVAQGSLAIQTAAICWPSASASSTPMMTARWSGSRFSMLLHSM